jgi:hypothetical protein
MSDSASGRRIDERSGRKPFRAVDVLSGSIDKRTPAKAERTRKQISAQLEPAQVRLLGEIHARLNATANKRIEKSDLVGLGIELLAAALDDAGREPAPAPDAKSRQPSAVSAREGDEPVAFHDADELRAYVRSYVRKYGS